MKERRDFWSRRKQAVEAEAETEVSELIAAEEKQDLEALEQKTDAEILEELGLPDPETLEAGDDFAAFMSKTVPNRLRNRALRKLWLSDPMLANLDALVDYGEDFTINPLDTEVIQTTYQVGKGLLAHVKEMERQEEAAKESVSSDNDVQEEQEVKAAEEIEEAELTFAEPDHDLEEQDVQTILLSDEVDEVSDLDTVITTKKRMRFVFEAQT